MFEVEQKYVVAEHETLTRRLTELQARKGDRLVQVDRYFGHPCRDFAATDEALRLRQVGERNLMTYKGPKVDRTTKTRREIEIELAAGDRAREQQCNLLLALGFNEVLSVEKQRQLWHLEWDAFACEIALDEVKHLGTYAELETGADEESLDSARSALASLAEALDLHEIERRSYLELLLA